MEESVLDLSPSDTEDEDHRTFSSISLPGRTSPLLRASLVTDPFDDTEIEIGTAQAISTAPAVTMTTPPRITSVRGHVETASGPPGPFTVPRRRSSRMFSYLSDQSVESTHVASTALSSLLLSPSISDRAKDSDLPLARRGSDRISKPRTRYMRVTRQEETLLAALRWKRAALPRSGSPGLPDDGRQLSASVASDSGTPTVSHQPVATEDSQPTHRPSPSAQRYYHLDRTHSPDSCTTSIQTHSIQDGSRCIWQNTNQPVSEDGCQDSQTTFESGSCDDAARRPSTQMSLDSLDSAARLMLRGGRRPSTGLSTQFSMSTPDWRGHSRRGTETSHVVVLDHLDEPSQREICARSQDFITWPYRGWDLRAQVAAAN